ncbi:aldehyde dehydrogenase [Herbaspirillum sp. RTI4]|uniref:aldehyde dehydrogenase n=1 Tax=Herbaspirillum sp. RTI4 TaxID=3048640 RepID=UPI002AB33177|nr:aldehyde dehydrogenase [Herbaspirillum sp. RTI4]MDY7577285.1 aldehyde dehydrogenase [Herbaspirillum sp. RTI4]MEA9982949.1 aldehyde dehydrogenase [Herbaspirillum sp. RTI4]
MRWKITSLIVMTAALLCACDHSVDDKLAAIKAAERSLDMAPAVFAEKFNQTLPEVLFRTKGPGSASRRMARLYVMDVDRFLTNDQPRVFEISVGMTHTTLLGSMTTEGKLKTVGVLLTERTQAARDEFFLCAEATGKVFVNEALLPTITRLTNSALDFPGQRATEVIGDKVFSTEVTGQGLLFQIGQKQ